MERNYEDKLTELAFGELNPEEAARLEARAQADPLAARELAFTRRLREDLLSLGDDVPPDQLSKERLRQAILTNGLHPMPVKRSLGLGWLWAPAAAFAAAFVFVFLRSQPTEPMIVHGDVERGTRSAPLISPQERSQRNIVAGNLPSLRIDDFARGAEALRSLNPPAVPAGREEPTQIVVEDTKGRAQALQVTEVVKRSRPETGIGPRTVIKTNSGDLLVAQNDKPKRNGAGEGMAENGLMRPDGSSGPDSTIVLIRAGETNAAGAQTATELEKENVLVGG